LGLPLIEDVVVELVENPSRVITRRELSLLGEIGDTLQRWGAVRQGETLTSIACDQCGDDHFVDLEFDSSSGAWRYCCLSVGFVAVAAEDLITFRFDVGWLSAGLAESLLIRRPRHRELVPDVLWDLGDAGLGGRPWSAFLARAIGAQLDPILDALRTRGGKLPGLVLASSPTMPLALPLPYGHRFLLLRDALDTTSGRLDVAHQAVLAALRSGVSKGAERARGRPSCRSLVLEIFGRRLRAGETAAAVGEEARAVLERVLREEPGLRPPASGTVENIIRHDHASWRAQNPRSTK
jgi:hypothetical protein